MRHRARFDAGGGWEAERFRLGLPLALGVLLASLGGGVWAAPASNSDCALLMPLAEVVRGKGAFLSGCETLSATSYLGGCWTQSGVDETTGCQTCYIKEDSFADALFPVKFSEELDPCPSSVDYTTLYETEHGALSIVTAASLTYGGCPDGWLYSEDTDHCYLKSANTAKAADQGDAASKCEAEAEGAWLVSLETEAENSFLVNNMLWIGFFGETYTGMRKTAADAAWGWPAEAAEGATSTYDCQTDFSDWLDGPTLGCEASYNGGAEGSSCMEIYPYEPKGWNPFSCFVGKHYVCEIPATSSFSSAPSAVPSLAPSSPPSLAPASLSPTAAPTAAATGTPTLAPTGVPTPFPSITQGGINTTEPTAFATDDPTGPPSVAGDGDRGATLSPIGSVESPSDTATGTWEGDEVFSVAKTGMWGEATYSLFLREGGEEFAVAEDVTKDGLGTEEDDYLVKVGCYRLQVTSPTDTDPSTLTWDVTGGFPFRSRDLMTGNGLDGALFTVGGGVCGVGICESSCLENYFSTASGAGGACDGYRALIAGECSDVCDEEEKGADAAAFQEMCVRAECDAELVCGVEDAEQSVGVDSYLELKALLSGEAGDGGGVGDGQEEFEDAVASWLKVDRDMVLVTAVNGVDVEEVEISSFRRKLLLRGGGGDRALQSDSTNTTEYARYTCQVKADDMGSDEATGLHEKATESGAGGGLEALLQDNGGVMTGVSVVDLEAEVMRDVYVVGTASVDGDAQELDGDRAWYEDDPLATGGIAAGAVVMLGLVIFACCVCRQRAASKTRRRKSSSALTQDFEGGSEYEPSDLASQQYAENGTYKKDMLPSKEDCFNDDPDSTNVALAAAAAAAAASEPDGGRDVRGELEDVTSRGRRRGNKGGRPPMPPRARARRANFATLAIESTPQEPGDSTPSPASSDDDDDTMSAMSAGGMSAMSAGGVSAMSGGGVSAMSGEGMSAMSGGVSAMSGGLSRGGSGGGVGKGGRWSRAGSTCSDAPSTAVPQDMAVLSAQDSTVLTTPLHASVAAAVAAGKASGKGPYQRSPSVSSKISVLSDQTSGTMLSATKQPNVRGPSGALASLGVGHSRGESFDSVEYDGPDGTESAGTFEGSAAGWSDAGSRFPGGAGGSSHRDYDGYKQRRESIESITEERIRAVQLSDSANLAVTVASQDLVLPSPTPLTPGTDWELAQDLAPTPNEERKTDRWAASPARKENHSSHPDGGDRTTPRGGSGAGKGGTGNQSRPPVSRSGSFRRGVLAAGGVAPSSSSPGGAYDSDAASRVPSHKAGGGYSSSRKGRSRKTPSRSLSRGTAPSRGGGGRNGRGGAGGGGGEGEGRSASKKEEFRGDADSDCESRAPGFTVTPPRQRGSTATSDSGNPFDAHGESNLHAFDPPGVSNSNGNPFDGPGGDGGWSDVGGRGGGGGGAPAVRLPSVFDSDNESRFYGTLSAGMSDFDPDFDDGSSSFYNSRRSDATSASTADTGAGGGGRRFGGNSSAFADSASGSVAAGFPTGPSVGSVTYGDRAGDKISDNDDWRAGWKSGAGVPGGPPVRSGVADGGAGDNDDWRAGWNNSGLPLGLPPIASRGKHDMGGAVNKVTDKDAWRGGWKNYSPAPVVVGNGFGADSAAGSGRARGRGSAGAE